MGVLKRILLAVVLAVVLAVSSTAYAQDTLTANATLWDTVLYLAEDTVTVAWTRETVGDAAETYEVVAVWEGPGGVRGEYFIGETSALEMVVPRPRVGFFYIKVRAKNDAGEVSGWAISTDPDQARVNGEPKGWRIYFYITPPSEGGIE